MKNQRKTNEIYYIEFQARKGAKPVLLYTVEEIEVNRGAYTKITYAVHSEAIDHTSWWPTLDGAIKYATSDLLTYLADNRIYAYGVRKGNE